MISSFPAQGRKELITAADTRRFGQELGAALEAGDVVILDGPLGAGKTTFTQGIAEGMQVRGRVTSPTFVIAREHRSSVGGAALVHVDAYRLLDESGLGSGDPLGELDALDLDTDIEHAVVVAEWGGGLVEQITERYLHVHIDREEIAAAEVPGDDENDFSGEPIDPRVFTWTWVG